MNATPETLAAFEAWKNSELASHYASPCPDDVMTHLTTREGDAFDQLQLAPAACAEDVLLKLFPILLREFEPGLGEDPMRPGRSRSCSYDDAFYDRLIADIGAVSPVLLAAMQSPHRERAA